MNSNRRISHYPGLLIIIWTNGYGYVKMSKKFITKLKFQFESGGILFEAYIAAIIP